MPIRIVVVLLFSILVSVVTPVHAQDVKVGILAVRGIEKTVKRWYPLIEYLQNKIPQHDFSLVPLDLPSLSSAVADQSVDFILTNTGNYVVLEHDFSVTCIATLRNMSQGLAVTQFGAVIFTNANRTDIKTIRDVKGQRMMAVSKKAFGGFQMAWQELKKRGINPFKDTDLRFSGLPQDQIVYAVKGDIVDVGTVRTGILERMQAEGVIKLFDFRILEPRRGEQPLPFALTTRLYPEWPFAKTAHVDSRLAKNVAIALLTMPENSPMAEKANYAGWTVPLDYTVVHNLFKDLSVGPYGKAKNWLITVGGDKKSTMLFAVGLTIMLFCLYLLWNPLGTLKKTIESDPATDPQDTDTTGISPQHRR